MSTDRRPFSAEDDQAIRDHYKARGAQWVADQIGRSVRQIWRRAHKIGIADSKPHVYQQKLRIAEEFGAPFADVCRWFAEAGHSMQDTASILGMRVETFRQEILSLNILWPSRQSASRLLRGQKRTAEQKARIRAANLARAARWVTVKGITDSVRGHCRRFGVSRSTVRSRRAAGYSWERCFDPAPIPRGNIAGQGRNVNHPWRKTADVEMARRAA